MATTSQAQDAYFTGMESKLQEKQHGTKQQSATTYQTKKLGDLMDEMDSLLLRKRYELRQELSQQVQHLLNQLNVLYEDLQMMANQKTYDHADLVRKQLVLNKLENKAVQGVYGVRGQIDPLDRPGQQPHHIRLSVIPEGQATVRDLIERCHQIITRIFDRVEATGQESKKHEYEHKKLGDILDEMDVMAARQMPSNATEKVKDLLNQLHQLHREIKGMARQQNVDLRTISTKQNQLNELESKAVHGVYGVQAQIIPLEQVGSTARQVRVQHIPSGQAQVRHLVEQCHQLLTRILERVEEQGKPPQEQQQQQQQQQQQPKQQQKQQQQPNIKA